MPDKSRSKRPRDLNQLARAIVLGAAGEIEVLKPPKKNPAAVALGSRGGKARAANLTKEQRQTAAQKAVKARWAKQR